MFRKLSSLLWAALKAITGNCELVISQKQCIEAKRHFIALCSKSRKWSQQGQTMKTPPIAGLLLSPSINFQQCKFGMAFKNGMQSRRATKETSLGKLFYRDIQCAYFSNEIKYTFHELESHSRSQNSSQKRRHQCFIKPEKQMQLHYLALPVELLALFQTLCLEASFLSHCNMVPIPK